MPEETANDKEIILEILKGETSAYAVLVRKYQDRILSLCTKMLSDPKDAEDAAQESFTKAFYALSKFKGDSSFYTWIYRIASNQCLDIAKKKGRQKTSSWDELIEQKGDEIEALVKQTEPSEKTEDEELVSEVLSCLSADYRLILTLREMEGLSYEEIKAVLGCSLDGVKGRLKRAREAFREKIHCLRVTHKETPLKKHL